LRYLRCASSGNIEGETCSRRQRRAWRQRRNENGESGINMAASAAKA